MAQNNSSDSPERIGRHLGDLSPSKAVETAGQIRDKRDSQR